MAPQLSHNNHFRFGFSELDFQYRSARAEKWRVEYGRASRAAGTFPDECINAAQKIAASTTLPLWLCLSGGIDSEVVAQVFLKAGIPFNAAIMRFAENKNAHDIRWAEAFCRKHNVPLRYFDIDPEEFWKSRALAYAERAQSPAIGLTLLCWLLEQVPGFPVLGSGECHLVDQIYKFRLERRKGDYWIDGIYLRSSGHAELIAHLEEVYRRPQGDAREYQWCLSEKESIAGLYRFLHSINKAGAPGFFQYTPEIILAYLNDPLILQLTNNEFAGASIGADSSEAFKHAFYSQFWSIEPRPKATGFEQLTRSPIYISLQAKLFAQMADCSDVFYSEVEKLRKNLSPTHE